MAAEFSAPCPPADRRRLPTPYTATWVNHLGQIDREEWNALALPLATPFLEWDWLHNLETSGSVSPQEGWLPVHLTVRRAGRLVAAAPLYVKGHSYGEFVFDQQWAALADRLGIDYYPKLLGATPLTPAEGYRFLIASGEDEAALTRWMIGEIDHFCDRNGLSGCHFLFVDPAWQPLVEACGFLTWQHHSYIWQNNNFANFEDYLAQFNANQRRNIKRERKALETANILLKPLRGAEIPTAYFDQVYEFYRSTCDKFWGGSKYLTRKFFQQLHGTFDDRVVLFVAHEPGDDRHPLGLSFCLTKGDRLYGRYWGSRHEIDCLHFNACYYAPIEWAIAQGIQMFDPGAGGQHKKRRGFPAQPNHSLHRLYHPRLEQILRSYLSEVNEMERCQIAAINQELPFNQERPNPQEFLA